MNASNKFEKIYHDIESVISSIELAFYGALDHPGRCTTYRDLFEKSVEQIRMINSQIKQSGENENEKTNSI